MDFTEIIFNANKIRIINTDLYVTGISCFTLEQMVKEKLKFRTHYKGVIFVRMSDGVNPRKIWYTVNMTHDGLKFSFHIDGDGKSDLSNHADGLEEYVKKYLLIFDIWHSIDYGTLECKHEPTIISHIKSMV